MVRVWEKWRIPALQPWKSEIFLFSRLPDVAIHVKAVNAEIPGVIRRFTNIILRNMYKFLWWYIFVAAPGQKIFQHKILSHKNFPYYGINWMLFTHYWSWYQVPTQNGVSVTRCRWFLMTRCSALWQVHELRRTLSVWYKFALCTATKSFTTGRWPLQDAHNSAVIPSYHRKHSRWNTTKLTVGYTMSLTVHVHYSWLVMMAYKHVSETQLFQQYRQALTQAHKHAYRL